MQIIIHAAYHFPGTGNLLQKGCKRLERSHMASWKSP